MASRNTTQNPGVINVSNDAITRVINLEGRVDRLEEDVSEIKAGVRKLLERPQNPGFGQVITTLFSTMAAIGLIFTFAEWRLSTAIEPARRAVAEMTERHDGLATTLQRLQIDIAVMRAREARERVQ